MRVLKFGGTSVGDAQAIERLAAIVRRARDAEAAEASAGGSRCGLAIVVSALAGATDCLLGIADTRRPRWNWSTPSGPGTSRWHVR
jgi:aspartokinase/homoserine dehydrogenase 1